MIQVTPQTLILLAVEPVDFRKGIHGNGFKTPDQIAQKMGIPVDSLIRACARLSHVLLEATGEGHCALPIETLKDGVGQMLLVEVKIVTNALERTLASGDLVRETIGEPELIFLPHLSGRRKHRRPEQDPERLVQIMPPILTLDPYWRRPLGSRTKVQAIRSSEIPVQIAVVVGQECPSWSLDESKRHAKKGSTSLLSGVIRFTQYSPVYRYFIGTFVGKSFDFPEAKINTSKWHSHLKD